MSGVNRLFNYNTFIRYIEKSIEIWGQPCTVFQPTNVRMTGYEDDVNPSPTGSLEPVVPNTKNTFTNDQVKGFIDFNPKRSVFYQFNYFPEENEELVLGFFSISDSVKELQYVRTRSIEQVSVWGDILFRVVHIEDIGKYKSLKRMYFLRAINDQTLADILVPTITTRGV